MFADGLTKKIIGHEPMERFMSGQRIDMSPTLDQKNNTGVKADPLEQ